MVVTTSSAGSGLDEWHWPPMPSSLAAAPRRPTSCPGLRLRAHDRTTVAAAEAAIGWEGREGIGDAGNQFHYYRLTADDRILWGGYDAVYYFGSGSAPSTSSDRRPSLALSDHFFAPSPSSRACGSATLGWGHRHLQPVLDADQAWRRWHGGPDRCSRSASCSTPQGGARRDHHRRARQGALRRLGEVTRGLEVVEFACGIPHLLKGGFSENVSTGVDVYSIRQPLGVVGIISPFNFPAMVPMWFFPIAIACGNTVVSSPSEKDPSASTSSPSCGSEAGLPDGVFNVVHGDKEAVDALLEHPDVKSISFVGSTPIAKYVYETGTAHGKRVQALGGAKNHMLVLPDADLDLAADAASTPASARRASAAWRSRSSSPSSRRDELVEKIRADGQLRTGDGTPRLRHGPAGHRQHRDKVPPTSTPAERRRDAGRRRPGLDVDGDPTASGSARRCSTTSPRHVGLHRRDLRPGALGRAGAVLRRGLALINDHPYGNGTAIFTNDGGAARRFQNEVEVGMVGINVPIPVPMAYYSFGGWKNSLFGDSHAHGTEGVHFFTRGKVVTSALARPEPRRHQPRLPAERVPASLALRTDGLQDLRVLDAGDVEMFSGDAATACRCARGRSREGRRRGRHPGHPGR
jgi:malonate-semialdehyde dehydrogenase (acetylating) / methylmalonate-semialdehyde dehydrogenase